MSKEKFKLENYAGGYVMHCDTENKANIFCKFLHEQGRQWNSGRDYTDHNNWEEYGKDTCYYFNNGSFCKKPFYEEKNYTILEFDDFYWEELRKDEGKMKATLKINGEEIEVEISEKELEKLKPAREVNYAGLERLKDLYEKLTKFAVEHRDKKYDCRDAEQSKYHIYYNYKDGKFEVDLTWRIKYFGQICFDRKETAEKAIEEFKEELEWYYTEFKDSL